MTPKVMADIHARAFPDRRMWTVAEFEAFQSDPAVLIESTAHGFAIGRLALDEVEVVTVAVDPVHQRGGHGRVITAALLKAARSKDALRGFLEVAENNQAARALYDDLGFTEVGRRKGYYRTKEGDRQDALVLSTKLSTETA